MQAFFNTHNVHTAFKETSVLLHLEFPYTGYNGGERKEIVNHGCISI